MTSIDPSENVQAFWQRLHAAAAQLETLLDEVNDHWVFEDSVYRYYSGSFKVYRLQNMTAKVVEALRPLGGGRDFNPLFADLVAAGSGKVWEQSHNRRWREVCEPIVSAFLHARAFLELAVQYSKEEGTDGKAPLPRPSGWAALLSLFDVYS